MTPSPNEFVGKTPGLKPNGSRWQKAATILPQFAANAARAIAAFCRKCGTV